MIFTVTLCLILASFVACAVFLDLKRADERRQIRERRRLARTRPVELFIHADISGFVAKMQEAARAMADMTETGHRWQNAVYPNLGPLPRCRWCQVLGRVGLAPHAVHYQPRHRAGRA